jgi:hypothetical protein
MAILSPVIAMVHYKMSNEIIIIMGSNIENLLYSGQLNLLSLKK